MIVDGGLLPALNWQDSTVEQDFRPPVLGDFSPGRFHPSRKLSFDGGG
jgi:hypothetical protein